jgi:CheY-like chemotaxis protein
MNSRIVAAVDEMFFAAKIRATAEQLGLKVDFARSADQLIESAEKDHPAVIIIDLHSQRCDPFSSAERLKANAQLRSIPVIGFFSHVETELERRARRSGFDQVLARSAFTKRLPEILRGKI